MVLGFKNAARVEDDAFICVGGPAMVLALRKGNAEGVGHTLGFLLLAQGRPSWGQLPTDRRGLNGPPGDLLRYESE